jgi:hypothetical protein
MQYRAYEVRDAQPIGAPIVIEAADDAAAIDMAERFLNGAELQLWLADRLVVTLNAAGLAFSSDPDGKNPAAGQPGS